MLKYYHMAKFYGKTGWFLSGKELKYFLYSIVLVVLPAAVVIILYSRGNFQLVGTAALIALVFIVRGGFGLFNILKLRSTQFYRGRSGERKIKEILKQLPEEFYVFENVFFNFGKGNLDFVVIWPRGVAVLEVKSMGGEFGFDGKNLLINGRPIRGKNLIKQAQGQMWALKKYLKARTGAEVFVSPALVFAHNHASVLPTARNVGGVSLVEKNYLPDWLYLRQGQKVANFEKVAQAMKETV